MYSAGTSPASTAPAPGGNLVSSRLCLPFPVPFLPFCPSPSCPLVPGTNRTRAFTWVFPHPSPCPIGSQLAAEAHAKRSWWGFEVDLTLHVASSACPCCHWEFGILICCNILGPTLRGRVKKFLITRSRCDGVRLITATWVVSYSGSLLRAVICSPVCHLSIPYRHL